MRWSGLAGLMVLGWLAASMALAVEPLVVRLTPDVRAYPQFFSVAQDGRRQIYVGGTDGIVRNDGGRWIWEPSPKPGPVRVLYADAHGRVWYGGMDSFGYLENLPTGEQRFVDLAPQFAHDLHGAAFADIWQVTPSHGLLWFRGLHDLFAVDADGRRAGYWHRQDRLGYIGEVHGELWLQWRGEGMRRWDGHAFVPLPGGQAWSGALVYDVFPLPGGAALVHDFGQGLSLWQNGVATALDDAALHGDIPHLEHGVALDGSRFAFAGDDGRLRILDLPARRIDAFRIGTSFISDVVRDRDGALLAVDNQGVVRLPWPPRWFRYAAADGVAGDVHDLWEQAGRLFVCGSAGVAQARMLAGEPLPPLQPEAWTSGECWQTRPVGHDVLIADSLSLLRVVGDGVQRVSRDDLYPRAMLVDPQDASLLWVGTEQGAALFRVAAEGLHEVGRIGAPDWRITTLAPAPHGVWMGSDNHGLMQARVDPKAAQGFALEPWDAARGVLTGADGEAQVSAWPEGTVVSTSRGLFRETDGRFVSDPVDGLAALLAEGEVVRLLVAPGGDRWAFSYHGLYHQPRGGHWQTEMVGGPALGAFETLLAVPGGKVLVGASGTLLRFDGATATPAPASHPDLRVTAMSLLRDGQAPVLLPLDRVQRVPSRGGGLAFDFGYTDFGSGDDKQYQVRLEGLTDDWSAWSSQPSYRVAALSPGRYVLHVRARSGTDAPVDAAPLRFEIVPRWYERAWVIPVLVMLGCGAIAAALIQRQRRRVRHLREHNVELDRMVRARTNDLEKVNLRLRDLADRDGLTGIANRRRFDGFLDECLQRAPDRGRPVGLAMIDVDHFKAYNDSHGHLAGDKRLCQVARMLADGVRGDTLAARYGGEEFAVVAPDCDLPTMREVAERLRAQIEAADIGVTVSIGICAFDPAMPERADVLLARADAALYRAKESGRNKVV
ncbi:MAG: GGDEF domain-containing protein [Proteobacteria bacterium]|nr:GGDEF domain-containing protein [Pseudomonadota bacterium]